MKVPVHILCLVSAFLRPMPAAEDPNVFRSVTVGFELTKPVSWQFVTAEQNLENLKNTRLGDKEFQKLMLSYATAPLVALMKHPEPFDDLNPSFKVNLKPLGAMKGSSPSAILTLLSGQMEKLLKDYQVSTGPAETMVSGLPTGYLRVHYTLETSGGRAFQVTSELWVIPRGDYFFMIGAGTRRDEATGSRAEIRKILKTVKISPMGS